MGVFLLMLVIAVVIWIMFAFSDGGGSDIFVKTAKDAGVKYAEYQNGTGIAITNNREIILYAEGKIKTYTFDKVRDYRKSIQDAGGVLSVSVKDIDYPEWHIKIRDKKILSRWFEILQQELSD